MYWNFNDLGLELALNGHLQHEVARGTMPDATAHVAAQIVRQFLCSPHAGILRLQPIAAHAQEYLRVKQAEAHLALKNAAAAAAAPQPADPASPRPDGATPPPSPG